MRRTAAGITVLRRNRAHAPRWLYACLAATMLTRARLLGDFVPSFSWKPLIMRHARSGQEADAKGSIPEERSAVEGGVNNTPEEQSTAKPEQAQKGWEQASPEAGRAWGAPFSEVRFNVSENETMMGVVVELNIGVGLGVDLDLEPMQPQVWQLPEVNYFTHLRIMDCIDGNCTIETLEEFDGKLARDEQRIELAMKELRDQARTAQSADVAARLDWFRTFLEDFHELREKLRAAMGGSAPAW